MFINPKVAIEKGWIKGIKDPAKQVQPNAIDFTLDDLRWIDTNSIAWVSETGKTMRRTGKVEANGIGKRNGSDVWLLQGNCVYDGTSEVYVEVPEGVAAVLYTRSTFARNGVFIASGLYDSGYKGQVGFTIYTIGGDIEITPGTRIGQIAFMHSDSANLYEGGWNHQEGTHYTEERNVIPPPPSTSLERPIGSNPNKSEKAQHLEDTHKWDSDQGGKPAGTKNFL